MCGGGGGTDPQFTPRPKPEPPPELVLDAEGEGKAGALRRRRKLRAGRSSLVTPGLSSALSISGARAAGASNGGRASLSIGGV